MSNEFKVGVKLHVDSTQYTAEFTKAGHTAQAFAAQVSGSASSAATGIQSITGKFDGLGQAAASGNTAAAAIDKITQSGRQAAGVLGAIPQPLTGAAAHFQAAQTGLAGVARQGDAVKTALSSGAPAAQALGATAASAGQQAAKAGGIAQAALGQTTLSAKQTAAALRGVPAQFTDIITSIQGGQAPLTVFLQQGGQLKDMFGGAGPAARALGGYVAGLVNPFTVAAAAAGLAALAYHQGSQEADGYRTAILMSGNAAGTTVFQLTDMARAISEVTGTQGAAAAALTQMAGSGAVARENLQQFAQTAMGLEKYVGQPVKATVDHLEQLGNAPLQASIKLNEQYHHLTVAVYEQIRALEEQGRKEEAGVAAQQAYMAAMETRKNEMVANLGSIERAWFAVTGAAKGAWDAMLNVGRATTDEQNLAQLRENLARQQERNATLGIKEGKATADLKEQIRLLEKKITLANDTAAATADEAKKAAALAEWGKIVNANKSKEKQQEDEILRIRNAGKAAGKEQLEIEREISAYKARTADKGTSGAAARELERQRSLLAELAGLSGDFYKEWESLTKQFQQGKITQEDLVRLQAVLLAKQPAMVAVAKEEQHLLEQRARAWQEIQRTQERAQQQALEALQRSAKAAEQQVQRLHEEEAAASLAASANIPLAEAVERVALARAEDNYQKALGQAADGATLLALQKEIDARREIVGLVRGKEAREGIKKTADEAEKELKRVAEQYEQGLTNAAMQGGKSLREYINGMLRTTAFRIVLDPFMRPLAGFLAGATGSGSVAASQSGGIMGTANLLSSAYSALTTGVSSSITAGFAKLAGSSFGQAIGLSNPAAIVGNNPSAFVPAGGQLTSLGQSIGTGLGMLGNGLAGYGISSAISNGYTTGGNTVNVIAGIASAFLGPIAGVVGGLINRAFGRKLKDTGIEGTIGGSAGFEGNAYQFYKGGWFRSDKTVRSDLDASVDKNLDTAVKQMQLSMAGLATSIGAPTEAISNFSQAIKVSFNGLDEAGIQEKIKETLADYNEGLASAFIASVDRSELPKWVDRLMGNVDASAAERLQAVAEWPAKLLQSFGTSRDQLAQLYAEGLARGDTAAAGQAVADSLVASIEASMLGNASAQVFDIVNQGIVTPMLDAIVLGQNVSEALSEASIQKTIARAKETAAAFAELWNNAEFKSALEDIRTTVGSALGQAGSAMEYIPRYTSALNDAAAAARRAEEAERKRIAALHESARKIVETQQGALDALKRNLQEAAVVQRGGLIGSLAVTAQEAEAAQQFTTALGDATGALAELEKLGLPDELAAYTAEIGKIVQETKSLLADQVASSRLLAGNARGALDALMSASTLAFDRFMDLDGREGFNAGAFNAAWAKEQALAARELGNQASANALQVQDVRSVLGALSQELYNPELLRPVYLGIRDAIVEASGTVGSYVVRDSVDAFARTLAEIQNVQGYQASGPGLASVYAAQRGLAAASTGGFVRGQWQMGADVVAYGQALDRLDAALTSGKITATEYEGALSAMNNAAGGAAELLGDVAAQAERAASMQRELGRVGLASVNYYFGAIKQQAQDLAAAQSAAGEPIARATEAIGRMLSVSAAFGDSARAAISGYGGEDTESRYMLSLMRQEGSSARDALLVAAAADIAAQVMTTQDAARVAQSLATQDAFADMTAAGIRDAALLLDGLSVYDPAAFERSFLRMNAALAAGDLTEQQYTTLYNKALDVFEGADEAARDLADSFKRVTESAIDLADALLRDSGVNTLTAGQTLEEMQRQYAESLAGAQANEAGAYSKYEAVTRAMLDRNLYATTADYEAAFATAVRDSRVLGAMQTAQPGPAAAEEEAKRLRLVGVPAFDVGTNYLPNDMLALVHQGERIVPAADNRELMRLVGGGAVGNEQVLELLRRILEAIESQDGGGSAAGGHPLERTLGSIRRDISDMLNGGLDVVVKNVVQTTAVGA